MSSPPITTTGDRTLEEEARSMLAHRIGSLVVVDAEGCYEGMVSARLFMPEYVGVPFMRGTTLELFGDWVGAVEDLEAAIQRARSSRVEAVMRKDAPTATLDTPISELASEMVSEHIHHIPIVDGE